MRVALLTENRDGVLTQQLARQLRRYAEVEVHHAGMPLTWDLAAVDVVHSHTWETGLAGHLAKFQHGVRRGRPDAVRCWSPTGSSSAPGSSGPS